MRLIPFAMFAVLLAVVGPTLGPDDTKKDLEGLQGTWDVVELIMAGKPSPEEGRKAIKIAFKGEKMRLSGPGGIGEREYSFKLDPAKKPKAIDVTPSTVRSRTKRSPRSMS